MRGTSTGEFVSLLRVPALGGIELLQARFVTRCSHPHSHAEVEVGVVVTGSRLVRCRGRRFEATAGSVLIFAPGEAHAGAPLDERGSTYRAFLIQEAVLDLATGGPMGGDEDGVRPWFEAPVLRDRSLAHDLVAAHGGLTMGDDGSASRLLGALRTLAGRYRRPAASNAGSRRVHDAVRRVRDHLQTHYRETARLGALAQLGGLSVCQLVRVFRAATGLPPYAYLAQIRVHRAAELLRRGVPVSEVAFRTGFADQSHLTRRFKRLVGVPPGEYRRSAMLAGPIEPVSG